MKFDLYFWPIREQAWVLSWGLKKAMEDLGVLHRYGNIEAWKDKSQVPHLLNTDADVILFVGLEHFTGKIDTKLFKHRKAKFACWTYESLTDPYGAKAWSKALPKHFLRNIKEFHTGFTRMDDKALEYFDSMDAFFCADDLDYFRLKDMGRKAFWLPFGVDPSAFQPDGRLMAQEKNFKVEWSPRKSLVERAKIRYGTRYGIRSGRSTPKPQMEREVRSGKLLPGKRFFPTGAFIGTKSNIRVMLLDRLGLDLSLFQTPRKGNFGDVNKATEHTRNLARAYNSFLVSFNLRSIFAGVTPRAVESMSCGRLLFQYLCPPDRPFSRKMLTNCVKYEVLSNNGLNGVKEKYKYFISHPQEAMSIGNKARAEILHGHTLQHRVRTMIEKLSTFKKKRPQAAKAEK
jgi:hypothetical protein